MEVSLLRGYPALLVKKELCIAVGDLHIGRDLRLRQEGIHLPNATERLAEMLLRICRENAARNLVLLGDVKESIGNPTKEEFEAISRFFYLLRHLRVRIAKGNHDSRIEEIVARIGADAEVGGEIFLGRVALLHGHSLPSEEAMSKECVVMAHAHPALDLAGRREKVWVIAGPGREAGSFYKGYNRRIRLVMAPAFNELITGSDLSEGREFTPVLRKGIFDFEKARVYGLDKRFIGRIGELRRKPFQPKSG